ncbi:MAG: class I adenylate-forming enzyme family protein [Spirochaetota bacterium]
MPDSKNQNIHALLQAASDEQGTSVYFNYEDQTVTYAEGLDRVQRCASYLKGRGVKRGDRVVMDLFNTPEFVYTFMACAQLGAIAVLIGPVARRYEIDYIVRETDPSLIITSALLTDHFMIDGTFVTDVSRIWLVDENHPERNLFGVLQKEQPLSDCETITDGSAAAIIYTSAMDGYPLGVMLPHRGIRNSTKALAEFINPEDSFMCVLPLFHAFGLTSAMITPLQSRTPFHLVRKFSPTEIAKEIAMRGATVMPGVPKMFMMMNAMLPPGEHFPKLRCCISGGEGISEQTQQEIKDKYNLDVREGYGLTEASPIVTWNHMDTENRFGSVGKVMPWNEVRFVDDNGNDVAQGETGEIWVKGVNVTPGYYNRDDRTAEMITDGWMHTGDYGYMDPDGYVFLTGLKKNMVLNSAFNVYPKEVERILQNHPDVQDIEIIIHEEQQPGDIVRHYTEAKITSKSGTLSEGKMKLWCKDNISNYKIPRKFTIS